jgi:hypothetical protein
LTRTQAHTQFPQVAATGASSAYLTLVRIDLLIIPDFRWDENVHGGAETFVIMEDVDGEAVLFNDVNGTLEMSTMSHVRARSTQLLRTFLSSRTAGYTLKQGSQSLSNI